MEPMNLDDYEQHLASVEKAFDLAREILDRDGAIEGAEEIAAQIEAAGAVVERIREIHRERDISVERWN